jgi:hypothetical protein
MVIFQLKYGEDWLVEVLRQTQIFIVRHFILRYLFLPLIKVSILNDWRFKQDTQCTYNVTLTRIYEINVAVEKQ